jgi:hypothetical protein
MTAAAIDLTGVGTGHYAQRDRSHATNADLVQTGHLLTGVVRDNDTKVENSLFESAVEAGLPPGGRRADRSETAGIVRGRPPCSHPACHVLAINFASYGARANLDSLLS